MLGKYHYFVKNNICLIIDEITTGWRETLGGIYKKVGFRPDIVVFGKGMKRISNIMHHWKKISF